MTFALSKIFWWFASPGNLIALTLAAGLLLLYTRRRRRTGRSLVAVATLAIALITATPFAAWVMAPLERRFPPPAAPPHVDGVVVLGGGIDDALSAARGRPQFTAAAGRLFAMSDLARRHPEAKLIYSGGTANLFDTSIREADIAAEALSEAGVPPDRVTFERDSRNTYENALFSQRLAEPQPGEVWLLVTSAYHMPRAVGIFRRLGWAVTPYPTDYRLYPDGAHDTPWAFLDGLETLHWAMREWFGLAFYRLAGRTDALFPAPRAS